MHRWDSKTLKLNAASTTTTLVCIYKYGIYFPIYLTLYFCESKLVLRKLKTDLHILGKDYFGVMKNSWKVRMCCRRIFEGFFQNLRIKFSPIIWVNLDVRKHLNLTWPNFLGKFCSKYREQDMPVKNKIGPKTTFWKRLPGVFWSTYLVIFGWNQERYWGKCISSLAQLQLSNCCFHLKLTKSKLNYVSLSFVPFLKNSEKLQECCMQMIGFDSLELSFFFRYGRR